MEKPDNWKIYHKTKDELKIKELSPGDDHEIWGAASTTKLTIYCYA